MYSFHPNKYGNPAAKRQSNGDNLSQYSSDNQSSSHHPAWNLLPSQPTTQPTSWGASVSVDDTPKSQHVGSEGLQVFESRPASFQELPDTIDIPQSESGLKPPSDSIRYTRSAARSPSQASITIPGFNKKGYGHPPVQPSNRQSSKTPAHNREQIEQSKNLPITTTKAVTQDASDKTEPKTTPFVPTDHQTSQSGHEFSQQRAPRWSFPAAADEGPQPSIINSDVKGRDLSSAAINPPPATRYPHQAELATPEKKPSPPATYQTLKKKGESPEEVIARLQATGTRDAHLRMRRTAKGEVVTTGLSTLDFLRGAPASEPDGILPAHLESVSFPSPRDSKTGSNPGPRQSLGDVGFADEEADRKGQKKTSVSRPAQTFTQPSSSGVDGPDVSYAGRGVVPVTAVPSNTTRATTTTRIVLRDSSDEPVDSAKSTISFATQPPPSTSRPIQTLADRNRNRWATSAETKPEPCKADSNAEGSEVAESDDDSTKPMEWGYGRLIRNRGAPVGESQLVGWDGQLQPPPVDWETRAAFQNNNPEYISGFDGWLGETAVRTMQSVVLSPEIPQIQSTSEIEFGVIPHEKVQDINNHADGIGFVSRDTLLNHQNAERYGHRLGEVIADVVRAPPADFEAEAKLDLKDRDNQRYRDETAQMFIDRRQIHLERQQKEAQAKRMAAEATVVEPLVAAEPARSKPIKTNIYLRPAVRADYAGMTRIYNWHIMNGVRPSELTEVGEDELEARHTISTNARLPFIVAVERTRRNSRQKPASRRVNPNHPVQNIDPEYNGVVKDEHVVGWASATDWSACDYVETTTAELEVYVAHDFRQKGVGRCLMDALLDATDRGYISKGGYDFHVAPEIKHLYSGGGGRDLHKIIFQIRSFNRPITPEQRYRAQRFSEEGKNWGYADGKNSQKGWTNRRSFAPEDKKDFSKAAKINDREDDYAVWMKDWLDSFGFEEEGLIKKIGTKHKRFVDVRYVSKETAWQPAEHRLPDFSNGI
ncbi:hypothetical protein LTR10_017659 [Elasticomyces elasticus]|uniref:N-acetyltransferase domain-containing protein n=1 Tax=Exophiala sideris TaxID=1016849 RepID=A0ABR0JP80_9EURO|nr:hypothetical protein LTR10_017659 [Elasticomyces elasticus]KAK5038304.1 hypothetical protein LTS07_001774 [Exophiala sideris]KAK5044288.1 hypothetical protein LTR13_000644 [Exophiala sideris]KAK5067788.1 hypothetical protein LTR69_001777 [Exophiala sideris]KAK5183972.1 hypothetical protein LTR44_003477 [Eurotiomycetes sp. CCFEE 6388]